MKISLSCIIALLLAVYAPAETGPTLVFSGYIDYPAKHEYRIEVFTYPDGLISKVVTLSGEPQEKYEEMAVTRNKDQIIGVDQFQKNLKTVSLTIQSGTIQLAVVNENLETHKKTRASNTIRVKPGENILFDDNANKFSLLPGDIFRIESKSDKDDVLVVQGNQILVDGWYRSDWKRGGAKTTIREYTAMENPGDWISDGGGEFTGNTLNTKTMITNIVNYYILDVYLERRIFLPWLFGLKTGSY